MEKQVTFGNAFEVFDVKFENLQVVTVKPHIGEDGYWYVGTQNTGVKAEGKDGITPHIGANGNWWIGDTDTGVSAIERQQSVTHSELVALRDNGELVAGMQYRIVDFVTTTSQDNTQSAGHQFDIIVTATSNNTLSEIARAVQHEGDTYFSSEGVNFNAWEIKYCIDNDNTRFAWADEENGKGVIYYMKDEWDNECPYDFKNIMYLSYTTQYYYTFGMTLDASLDGSCYSNVIRPYMKDGRNTLSNNILGVRCNNNIFGDGCYNNSLGDGARYNKIVAYCWSNTFGNSCSTNTLDTSCNSIRLGESCSHNVFGKNSSSIVLGRSSSCNKFGANCAFVNLPDDAYDGYASYNTIGDNVKRLYVTSATKGSYDNRLQHITIGKGVSGRITVERNLASEQIYRKANTQIIILD